MYVDAGPVDCRYYVVNGYRRHDAIDMRVSRTSELDECPQGSSPQQVSCRLRDLGRKSEHCSLCITFYGSGSGPRRIDHCASDQKILDIADDYPISGYGP